MLISLDNALLKFEINVSEVWSGNALQKIFTPHSTSGTNSYIADGTNPREGALSSPKIGIGNIRVVPAE